MSLQSLSVAGEPVPLIKSHDPLVNNPLVPSNDWTAPVNHRIVLNDRLNADDKVFLAATGALGEDIQFVCLCLHLCRILCPKGL